MEYLEFLAKKLGDGPIIVFTLDEKSFTKHSNGNIVYTFT